MDSAKPIPNVPVECNGHCGGHECYKFNELLTAYTFYCPMNVLAGIWFINDPSPKWSLVYPVQENEWNEFIQEKTVEFLNDNPELLN